MVSNDNQPHPDWNPPSNVVQAVRIYQWLMEQDVPPEHLGMVLAISQGYADGSGWVIPLYQSSPQAVHEEDKEELEDA